MRLSPHSAPIRQTCRSSGWSVARIEVLLFPVAPVMRPPDPTPSLQPHYEPSSLLRVGPPQCSASVRSPHGCGRLGFSLCIRATGSCSSAQQPASASRPLYAGRRPLSHQAPRGLVLGGLYAPGFDDTYLLNDASSQGLLSFVSRMLTCTGLFPRFCATCRFTSEWNVGRALDAPELGFAFLFHAADSCDRSTAAVMQRFVHFSAHPQVMEQHCQLSRGSHNGSLLAVAPTALGQFQAPAPEIAVDPKRSQDVLRALHQERP